MALNKAQRAIMDSLYQKSPQSIRQLALSTGLSESSVRQNLSVLVHSKQLQQDRHRQPYVYSMPENSPEMVQRAKVDKVKTSLYSSKEEPNIFIQRVKQLKKEQWLDAAEALEVIAMAIRELEADGQLLDTLEVG